jgi:hypothetical protein
VVVVLYLVEALPYLKIRRYYRSAVTVGLPRLLPAMRLSSLVWLSSSSHDEMEDVVEDLLELNPLLVLLLDDIMFMERIALPRPPKVSSDSLLRGIMGAEDVMISGFNGVNWSPAAALSLFVVLVADGAVAAVTPGTAYFCCKYERALDMSGNRSFDLGDMSGNRLFAINCGVSIDPLRVGRAGRVGALDDRRRDARND